MSNRNDPIARVRAGWGEEPPKEIEALAEACRLRSQRVVAREIGYTDAVVSAMLRNTYRGDVARVFAKIRGVYLGETVACPILGEIGRDQCLREQKRPFAATNNTRARLYHACKRCELRDTKEGANAQP